MISTHGSVCVGLSFGAKRDATLSDEISHTRYDGRRKRRFPRHPQSTLAVG